MSELMSMKNIGKEMAKKLTSVGIDSSEKLAGIEMLRSDFINNFSHEFKTPMVSILGFSRLLKKGDLTAEEQTAMMILKEELEQGYLTEGGISYSGGWIAAMIVHMGLCVLYSVKP